MVKPLNPHYSIESPSTIYDEEALTALELAARTARKVNECVDEVNQIPVKVERTVLAHMDSGDFDKAIDKLAGDVIEGTNARLDNLIGAIGDGDMTEREAEVVDARLGVDGRSYANLGQHIRTMFGWVPLWKTPPAYDANACVDIGFYFVGSGDGWVNIPNDTPAGLLETYNGGTTTRIYQRFHCYSNRVYYRHATGDDTFSDWSAVPMDNDTLSLKNGYTGEVPENLDELTTTGLYRLSSAHPHNGPEEAGMLMVMASGLENQLYHLMIGYSGNMRYRVRNNGVWTSWFTLQTVDETTSGGGASGLYYVEKIDNNSFYIYHPGKTGFIRYTFGKRTTDIKDVATFTAYGILGVAKCDKNKNKLSDIVGYGHDIEGVVQYEEGGPHYGGVHGYEQAVQTGLWLDGKKSFMNLNINGWYNNISIRVGGTIKPDGSASSERNIDRIKFLVFDGNGLTITNSWSAQIGSVSAILKPAMMSVMKENATFCFGPGMVEDNATTYPTETETIFSGFNHPTHFYWYGDGCTVHHWVETDAYIEVVAYPERIKTYFGIQDMGLGDEAFNTGNSHIAIEC